ncbi:MAG: SpoIIE family protein phosphatase [Nitrospinae bacterium]|nr:SpoIIE family protein phosphatase [Nitrospinota bacterium]
MNAEGGLPPLSGDKATGRKLASPLRLLAITAFAIFTAESVIMTALHYLPPLNEVTSVLLDAFGLVVLVFPALYFLLFRPLLLSIEHREEMEREVLRLAKIPEDNPDPIIEIFMADGRIHYANGSARDSFPEIAMAGGLVDWEHPLLAGIKNVADELRMDKVDASLDVMEVEIGDDLSQTFKMYGRRLRYIPKNDLLRIYTVDITKQEELTRAAQKLLAEVRSVKNALEDEHREAEEIGRSLLRKEPRDHRLLASVEVEPCSKAGGDRAGFLEGRAPGADEPVEWLAMFDASGHGKGASKFQEVALGGLLAMLKAGSSIDKALVALNAALESLGTGRFLVGEILRILKKGEAPAKEGFVWIEEFRIALHPILILDPQEDEARELLGDPGKLETGSLPLGLFDDGLETLAPRRALVRSGSRIVVCSDGVIEASNAAGELFGMGRLKEMTARWRSLPPEMARQATILAVKRWVAGLPEELDEEELENVRMDDDLTLAVVDVVEG